MFGWNGFSLFAGFFSVVSWAKWDSFSAHIIINLWSSLCNGIMIKTFEITAIFCNSVSTKVNKYQVNSFKNLTTTSKLLTMEKKIAFLKMWIFQKLQKFSILESGLFCRMNEIFAYSTLSSSIRSPSTE